MPDTFQFDGYSRFNSQNPTPEVYPLVFAAEGGQEKHEQFFQQWSERDERHGRYSREVAVERSGRCRNTIN